MSQKKICLRQVLADNMRRLRAERSLSQEEFADQCGLHRTYISDVERCTRNISIDNIERIAEAFEIPASDLLQEVHYENH